MQWLGQNFHEFFNIYWRDTQYRKTKKDQELLDFVATGFGEDRMTVEF